MRASFPFAKVRHAVLNHSMFRYLLFFLVGTVCLNSFAQSGPSPFKSAPLKVGVTPDSPPLIFKAGGEVEGIEAELARLLGRELGRPVRFIEIPWEEQIPALLRGETDIIMSGMTATKEREEKITFSDPYVEYGQMAMVRDADRARYPSARDIMATRGKVAVVPGTTGESFVTRFFPNADTVTFESPASAAKGIVTSKADVFIYDSPVILWLAGEFAQEGVSSVGINLTVEYLAWAMRPDDTKLQQQVAKAQEKLEADGEISWVLDRWLPERPKL